MSLSSRLVLLMLSRSCLVTPLASLLLDYRKWQIYFTNCDPPKLSDEKMPALAPHHGSRIDCEASSEVIISATPRGPAWGPER